MSNLTTLEKRFQKPKNWIWGDFTNGRGQALRYGHLLHDAAQAHVIYIKGLSEYVERNFELARDFTDAGYNFWTFDRHGQGKSGRFLSNIFKQHSEGLDKDVDDVVQMAKDILPDDGKPVILLGHSTGGLIATMALHDHPDLFAGGILSAPLFGIENPIVRNREHIFARALKNQTRLQEIFAPGSGPWRSRQDPLSAMKPEDFSSDPVRNKIHDYWQEKDPDLQIGGPTFGWLQKACEAIVTAKNPDYLKEIKQPVLIFTAGNDKLVSTTETFNAASHLPQVDIEHFDHGKHELLLEEDTIRTPLLQKSFAFIKKLVP